MRAIKSLPLEAYLACAALTLLLGASCTPEEQPGGAVTILLSSGLPETRGASEIADGSEIFIDQIANTELTYEKKYEWNVGVDLGFLSNRITLTTDLFWRDNFDEIGLVFTQGAVAALSNAVSMGVIGTLLLLLYAKIRPGQGTLTKE